MSGGETVRMQEGELWWFDNKAVHDAFNPSAEGRIHVIFDVLPARPAAGYWPDIQTTRPSLITPVPPAQTSPSSISNIDYENEADATGGLAAANGNVGAICQECLGNRFAQTTAAARYNRVSPFK